MVMASHSSFSSDDSDVSVTDIVRKRRRIVSLNSSEDFSDSSEEIIPLATAVFSSSEEEDDEPSEIDTTTPSKDQTEGTGNQPEVKPFIGTPEFKIFDQTYEKPEDCYSLFVNDEFFELVVKETNQYALKLLLEQTSTRLSEWKPTHKREIKSFFGLVMWMGIVKLPEIRLYWSKDPGYAQSLPPKIMPRNRFEILLRMLHFNDCEREDEIDCLHKIRTVIDMLNENFGKYYKPNEIVCVEESLNPFHGRIMFKQFINQKQHKYGIKIFKLCSRPGYTNAFRVYCGLEADMEKSTPTNIVLSLCKNIFGKGHTVCTEDWFTSIELAKKLVAQNTHLIGTIRSSRRGIPKDVLSKKLQRYEYIAAQTKDGFTVMKWKHKYDVLLLSTKHSDETVTLQKKKHIVIRPKVIVDYNEGKSYGDTSNQMALYCSPLRKTVKWYKKIVFELCLNTAVVNSWIIYNSLANEKITSVEFRKQLALNLMSFNNSIISPPIEPRSNRHEMRKKEGNITSVRKRCKKCYERNVQLLGSQAARNCTKKVATFCDTCDDKPHLCLPCFNEVHR